jgi:hypothetical protein
MSDSTLALNLFQKLLYLLFRTFLDDCHSIRSTVGHASTESGRSSKTSLKEYVRRSLESESFGSDFYKKGRRMISRDKDGVNELRLSSQSIVIDYVAALNSTK